MSFAAPLDDIRFALDHAAGLWGLGPAFPDLDPDLLGQILDAAADLSAHTLAPLNAEGDRAGVRFEPDGVRTAPGFKAAYRAFADGGWQGLSASPLWGGQGLPRAVALAVMETIHAANMAFGLAPMLTLGAIEALEAHGTDEQKATYLPKLIGGVWSGTMNLTEPQAGSDVGALTTRAVPQGDGSYLLTGQKIYITWGEHDLTDNIVHLVLARLPDAPPGSRGVSLFVAPRMLPDGRRNGLRCIGVERKMGIHASPTCTMEFADAKAWLVGAPNEGLACMFTMMNSARLNVGLEGVAVGEAAYQKALAYARERRQGRAQGAPTRGASPIVDHPDVQRMLLAMRARVQAGRALCYATAVAADKARTAPAAEERAAAKAREDLFTPLAKSWCTDAGVEVASLGVQVHGGMGFVEEGGAAQFYRDARIAPIYEGTNGIQAIDLVGRKLTADRGAAIRALVAEARETAAACGSRGGPFHRIGERLDSAAVALGAATTWLLEQPRIDVLAGASAYLTLAAETAGAMLVADGLLKAPPDIARAQTAPAFFFAETVLALAPARLPAIRLGADALASVS
jgi:alkylation response protein AidB-like acyl-CoA dehydrogenase